ncbi:MAG TPA: hypothetical protein ENJ80_09755 [Gammaproteobacteria bacterium]|nr:hypothetical protein [Gammaproteobacteria bacterium]
MTDKHCARLYGLSLSAVLLGGCAVSPENCDPNRGDSFVDALSGNVSGCYAVRQQKLKSELAEEEQLNQAFRELADAIEQEKQRLAGVRKSKEADLTALNQSWSIIQARLEQRSVENKALAVQVKRMEEKVAALNRAGDEKKLAEKQKLLNDLRREAAILNEELDAGLY